MAERTDAHIMLRLIYQAMLNARVPAEAVLARAGVALARLDEPSSRTPNAAQALFWQAAEEISHDPHIGLHLGEYLPLYRGQVLEYLFTSSPTFGDGLKRAMAFHRLLSDAVSGQLVVDDQHCYLVGMAGPNASRHFSECLAAGLIQFFRFVTDNRFQPLAMHFEHSEGAPKEEYERIYGCPATLGCSEYRLYFNREVLDHRIWQAESRLLRLHEQLASEQLAEIERHDLVSEVKRAIGEMLERGDTSLEAVANRLGFPPRRMRSQLAEANTSFNQILADYRSRLSRRLLAKTDEPIEQIVYLTGFSEPSTFYRAFKRWTNETPIEYRKRKREQAATRH
ncbi:MAG: AraC family transcriptional regulator [Moraxellaceae bacterium]|jgi:AraC-like DNA-binding protein|nr:AraC family transcriptional regulator [Moraxellaceae bacterium]MBP8852191.1 AraC family transcriptional regulator [Moraxellaceae bacterium]MBP9044935.1 AraC family transcriptional regulator [Moraxellaceae bacterium]MBP9730130.1 AraC family transcriptional regulator [Moraxellaceae bacterium]MCC6200699.1 AraC family transcriptional regulator [Moraxellaceae bacterium]